MTTIFDKVRLRPDQARTVADRRFDDADYLRKSKKNKHANGAMYVGGFVLECLLKAKLLEEHSWLQSPLGNLSKRTKREQALHSLCYQKHDLAGILERLSHRALQRVVSAGLLKVLKELCGTWTIYARYSPKQATMQEASSFLKQVRELKKWLR